MGNTQINNRFAESYEMFFKRFSGIPELFDDNKIRYGKNHCN